MKKTLLLTGALVALSTMCYAQKLEKATVLDNNNKANSVAAVYAPMRSAETQETNTKESSMRRSVTNGVYYTKPAGLLYVNSSNTYIVAPTAADVTYTNMYADKAASKWLASWKEYAEMEGEEDGNYIGAYPNSGYVWYIPSLGVEQVDTFTIGAATSRVYTADSIVTMLKEDRALNKVYYGFGGTGAEHYAYGSLTTTFDFDEDGTAETVYGSAISERYSKPLKPLYISGLHLWIVTANAEGKPLADGKEQKVYIVQTFNGEITEESKVYGEMTITPDCFEGLEKSSAGDVYLGDLYIKQTQTDAFGGTVDVPVIVDDEFAIYITGFNEDGIDWSPYMMTNSGAAYDVKLPTLFECSDAEGKYVGTLRRSSYNAFIMVEGMYDNVELYDDEFKNLVAPVDGGYVSTTPDEEGNASALTLYTACPWLSVWTESLGEENYYFVDAENVDEDGYALDMPSWLSLNSEEVVTDYYEEYGVYVLPIKAEPLPTGVEGRQAKIKLISDKGAVSPVITITQGTVDTGVAAIKTEGKAANATMFNVAGQRVDNSFKGLVIKNGAKFMNK